MTDAFVVPAGLRVEQPATPAASLDGPLVARTVAAVPPPLLLLFSIVSIQIGAAIAVHLFARLDPLGVVFLRLGISALLLLPVVRPRLAEARAHAGWLLLFGAVIAGMNLCFYEAIARLPLGIAVTIEFIGPLGVALATSRRALDLLWIALAVAGLLLLAPQIGASLDPTGLLLASLAGIGWACFVLLSRRVGRTLAGHDGLVLAMVVGSVLLLPPALAHGSLARLDLRVLGTALTIAVLATTIPFSLEFAALKRLSARAYGVLVTLEPAVAMGVGMVLLGQPATPRALLAASLVIAAAIGVSLFDRSDQLDR